MNGDPIVIPETDERALTPLDPAHVKLLRVQAAIMALPFMIASLVLESAELVPTGAFVVPVLLAAAWAIARVPLRRHAARGYDLGTDRLRVARGLWFRSDTVVPFGRVQHIDVTQGPLERLFGLATLVVHTAGTHNASVPLPGLAQADAAAMRESIRAHIKRETL
jgi:uncharacterized protein